MALCVAYSKLADSLATGQVDLPTGVLMVMLGSAYTVGTTQDDAQFVADLSGAFTEVDPVAFPDYAAGGLLLTGVTWTQSGSTFTLACDDPTWAAATIDAAFAVFYDATPGSDATNPLIGYWDFGGDVSSTGTDYVLTLNADGLLTIGTP